MTRLFLLSLILLLHNIVGHAQDLKLEIIPLRHRLTDEVLPVLQPLVAPGGTLSGMNNQLIIRTTETNLAELKQVLARIDQAARRLKIYVRQDVAGTGQIGEQSLSGRYRSGEVGVEVPGRGRDGLSISAGNGNEVRYRTYSTQGAATSGICISCKPSKGSPHSSVPASPYPCRTKPLPMALRAFSSPKVFSIGILIPDSMSCRA